jgi:2-C-methyl-D-erythritol 2,4-cyclodiphosphate synthase
MSARVGIGYDSHRFAAGRRLVLGGVEVPHEQGLTGHSDADVLTHAVTDALLGAAGAGDLGTHFPDDDERWRDADSIELLRAVLERIGGRVINADATVICEAPRLGPHREEMERRLTEALGAPASVKATTNEGMGALGRGEGIAAMAVVLYEARDSASPQGE